MGSIFSAMTWSPNQAFPVKSESIFGLSVQKSPSNVAFKDSSALKWREVLDIGGVPIFISRTVLYSVNEHHSKMKTTLFPQANYAERRMYDIIITLESIMYHK